MRSSQYLDTPQVHYLTLFRFIKSQIDLVDVDLGSARFH